MHSPTRPPRPNKPLAVLWEKAATRPLVFLTLVLALQTGLLFFARDLWYSDEIRYANVFQNVIHAKNWIVLHLNGIPYPDKPPVYFWFLTLISAPFGFADSPFVFFIGAALSGLIYLFCTYLLARKVAGADKPQALAAGLILLTCFYFVGVCHYSRMDLLFASLITLAQVCMFKGLTRERPNAYPLLGLALAGLATLTKGPLGLGFPLAASLGYLVWRGEMRRFLRRDVITGLIVLTGIILAWLGLAVMAEGQEFVSRLFYKEVYKRALDAPHHAQPFYHYFITLPLAWLPWTLILVAIPIRRLFGGNFWKKLWTGRKNAPAGTTYLWCMFLTGFALLSGLSIKIVIYLLPLFAPLAVLTAGRLLSLDGRRLARVCKSMAGLLVILALVIPWGNAFTRWPSEITGLTPLAATLAVTAAGLYLTRMLAPGAVLLTLALGMTLIINVMGLAVAPSLDPVMSPRAQAEAMGEYARDGYYPAAYKIYSGTYTYYAETNVFETQKIPELAEILAARDKVVLGMQKKYLERFMDVPHNLKIVHEQWIVDRPYVLLIQDKAPEPASEK